MDEVQKLLESGLLELYIMGAASTEDAAYVALMAEKHNEVKAELESIEIALEAYSMKHAIAPDPVVKPFLMATIDYMDRLEKGETPTFPPLLNKNSKVSDFKPWLDRPDMNPPEGWADIAAKIIGYTPEVTTAIAWIENAAPPEIHTDELESFLIIEGSCNIRLDGEDNYFSAGDFFTIPLYVSHTVLITSDIPCKVIIQRGKVAA
ncbi:cupin domain-containing protein [Taibaiella lutea]|uniref:Cupin domain-containing protein n=1 Tax=Taibaiella lutea TaxID=2608001 RepID=A0A5M6CKT1_9BACT|nr:cupin domain-containing protein [Taibaiella lutea]KAA5534592.1 cupin domain-containing protein [Taibaiella lutea]